MAREQWHAIDESGTILGFWASIMMFALVVFGIIIFSCAQGAESRDKSDDASACGGSACVAGCGAACGG
ncbi:hypothetical protein QVD17_39047 [Tagetes erecta]|uniref:Transmembrane protein n=1 Tax=Tagetes erecta TaxID=13708 RepID=A0AAD8NGR1_TARER|nr:hypothetical protein QVD17_39047 [Tagetes erecta]